MSTNLQTSIGCMYAVSLNRPATDDIAGYEAKTWTTVGNVSEIKAVGASVSPITFTPLSTGIEENHKGVVAYGDGGVMCGYDAADAGQILLLSGVIGANKNAEFSCRVTLQDGTKDYYYGKVFTATKTLGAAGAVVAVDYTIKLNSAIVTDLTP